jgi:phage tail sheath gpL-like
VPIDFLTIPASTRVPGQYIEFDASRAVRGLPQVRNRVLLIGLRTAAGTAAALSVQPVVEPNQAVALFGRGSMLARMAAAYLKADRAVELEAIALDEAPAGTNATGSFTFTGPATAPGTVMLMIAGTQIAVPVQLGDAAATIANRAMTAVQAYPDLPVVPSIAAAVLTLTARHKGTAGNQIDLRHSHFAYDPLPAGVGVVVAAMAGGATDPDIDTVWPVIGDAPYRAIVLGLSEAATLAKAETELLSRFGAVRQLETLGFAARAGTQGALAAFGAARNSQLVSVLGTGKSPSWAPEAAAIYAAFTTASSAIDPARPLQTLTLAGLVAPKLEDRFTRDQRDALLYDGISTFTVDAAGVCRIERAITTYQLDVHGLDDPAWLDLETLFTVVYLRVSVRSRMATKFPRYKLADDGAAYGPGQKVITPKVARAELIALAREWETAGLVENLDQYVADLIVERDASDPGRLNALIPPDLVNQFRIFAAAIQFRI